MLLEEHRHVSMRLNLARQLPGLDALLMDGTVSPYLDTGDDAHHAEAFRESDFTWFAHGEWYPEHELWANVPMLYTYTPFSKASLSASGLAIYSDGVWKRLSWYDFHAYDNLVFGKFMDGNKAVPGIWTAHSGANMFPGGYQLYAITQSVKAF